jgi:enoyl-[acyl-carrier-protein] reductase (NADH)
VLFLSSSLARHITGNVLLVDGGASLGAMARLGIAKSGQAND